MIILVLQAICIVLFAFGFLFSVLELRTRLDSSFFYFGIMIMLLAVFSAIDLWRLHQIWWISLQHILYFFIVPCIAWYLMILTKSKNILIIKGLLFIGLVFSFLVFGGFMFVQEDGFVGTKALYRVSVIPYIILSILYMNYLIVRKLRHFSGSEKKSLFSHLIGFLLLSICGIMDLLILFRTDLAPNLPGCTILGVIGLSAILCYSFADRLILIINERENAFTKLQMAYKELEEARSLSELGKSSAIINHEVRNYATVILGFAQLLKYNTALNDRKNRYHLLKGIDPQKDQSYFLALLKQKQLASACFPLGNLTKSEVLKISKAKGLQPIANRESQDICFIKDNNYGYFLEQQQGFKPKPGLIKDLNGNLLGKHQGLYLYTIGQRKGINCPASEPYYVVSIDIKRNILIVGSKKDLLLKECKVIKINWINQEPTFPIKVYVRVRYRHKAVEAILLPGGKQTAIVTFKNPQPSITPGQGAVFYIGDEVIGGGWIES